MKDLIETKYKPVEIEDKWYSYWLGNDFFHSEPDEREAYCMVIPPPNVTGVLHMGHMLNNTIQDVLVRRARMLGKNACWVPGTDHASIATEAKVVSKLKAQGIEKSALSREEFLEHAWEWTKQHGGIILEQLKKLGASCDWQRTAFTMDEIRYKSVINVFIELYNKGLIYRGVRMVNWDPQALTALSDEEVIHKETKGKLYYVRYFLTDNPEKYVTVATTRPETILGDTAVCIHPSDERYRFLKNRKLFVPLINREIPVIEDEYVDIEFGTGCLKITPAHDYNDYLIGETHKLPMIDIFNEDGILNEKAEILIGKDRFDARREIVSMLESAGHLEKIEDYSHNVGYSERTDVPIEPKLSTQWFLSMRTMAEPALNVVLKEEIHFHPPKLKNLYKHWMDNIRDWCISRQLWWGHQIPAFYLPDGRFVVAKNKTDAIRLAEEKFGVTDLMPEQIRQDSDVLDTWFSSWLWPLSVFDGIRNPDNKELQYYYPTNDLVTAPEILFFWVARMIMAGIEFKGAIPFKNVYFTGIVRDKLGRKMSKSLGNSPEPLDLIHKYGADGVRLGMLLTSPAGNDLPFDEQLCEQGRNFNNKIWNALRLVMNWEQSSIAKTPQASLIAIEWFENKLQETIALLNEHFENFRIADGLMLLYRVIWDDFCSWYLELIKPAYSQPVDEFTYKRTIDFFETIAQILHPYLPFITEEIWHKLRKREKTESIMISMYPNAKGFDKDFLENFDFLREVVNSIRNIRNKYGVSFKNEFSLEIARGNKELILEKFSVIEKLTNVKYNHGNSIINTKNLSLICGTFEIYTSIEKPAISDEMKQDIQNEIAYYEGFLNTVRQKLSNEKFVKSAPKQVIDKEIQKENDILEKLEILKGKL